MDLGNVNYLLIIAITPITSVVTILIQHFLTRRKAEGEVAVAHETARVSEMDVAFDGLTSNMNAMGNQLKEMRAELKEAKNDVRQTQKELGTTRGDLRRLENVVSDLRVERLHFLAHVGLLESLIPSPPGPPQRPSFMLQDPALGRVSLSESPDRN
jgi:hypothetical protein